MATEPKSVVLTEPLHEYLVAHGTPPDAVLADLIHQTNALGDISRMQIAPEQGAFMSMLTSLIGAKRAVEVGTFTGYSALCVARGLGADGHLLCCDVSEEWTAIGRRAWAAAGVADRIELRIAPGLETLRSLSATEQFDIAFIDADKTSYSAYFEEILTRLRRGGLLLVDNVLWAGKVIDSSDSTPDTEALRLFNDTVAADPRVEVVMLPIADGLSLIRKR